MSAWRGRVEYSLYRVAGLIRKEFWQLSHDKFYALLLVGIPLMLMVLVVNVVGEGGHSVSTIAVIDHDQTPLSRRLVTAVENTRDTRVKLVISRLQDANAVLSAGDVEGVIVIPPGFERDLTTPHHQTELLAVVDGTNIWAASRSKAAIGGAVQRFGEDLAQATGQSANLTLRPTKYFGIKRIHDPVSSQFAFLLYQIVLMVSGMGLAREREMGTLEQLLVTPLNRFELLLGKTMPALLIGVVNFWLLWVMGRLIWDVPTRGPLLLLFALGMLFVLAECAWGLFLSSQAANQQQATQLIFVQILVDLSFCGYIVPVDNLPRVMAWISELLPLRHYLECVRTVMLRGGDARDVAGHLAALLILNVVLWGLSARALRRRLD
jgi:ABC-2 type transport system permease protein